MGLGEDREYLVRARGQDKTCSVTGQAPRYHRDRMTIGQSFWEQTLTLGGYVVK